MEGKIRIAGTVGESIVDGPGFRYTLFVQGCPHAVSYTHLLGKEKVLERLSKCADAL